jgi:hypothetical protein
MHEVVDALRAVQLERLGEPSLMPLSLLFGFGDRARERGGVERRVRSATRQSAATVRDPEGKWCETADVPD